MSATPANVSSGRISEITPAIRNSTPKIHRIHRVAPPVSEPKTRFCAPAGDHEHRRCGSYAGPWRNGSSWASLSAVAAGSGWSFGCAGRRTK